MHGQQNIKKNINITEYKKTSQKQQQTLTEQLQNRFPNYIHVQHFTTKSFISATGNNFSAIISLLYTEHFFP